MTKAAVTIAILIIINIAVWVWTWNVCAERPTLLGTATLAYIFGLRHAVDADHIAAIDNIVRKLMQEGKAPFSAGLFFSVGHSSVVVLASITIALTSHAAQERLATFHDAGALIGTIISASFLLIVGFANLLILKQTWSSFFSVRRGDVLPNEALNATLTGPSFIGRTLSPLFRIVSRSWHMYPIGFLFGLGFDTATEIGVLSISATQGRYDGTLAIILIFPALFTAGMCLVDTLDSLLMTRAYGWALVNPARKLRYNLTITTTSVILAVFIGGIEILGILRDRYEIDGTIWRIVSNLNSNIVNFGFVIICIFIASWLISIAAYRTRGNEEPIAS